MPFELSFDDELGVRFTIFSGVLTDSLLLEASAAIVQRFADIRLNSVVDLRQVTHFHVTPDGVRQLRDRMKADLLAAPRRMAIVAATDLEFGISRIFEAVSQSLPATIRVFRGPEYDAALAWAREIDTAAEAAGS